MPLRLAILEADTPVPATHALYHGYLGVFTHLCDVVREYRHQPTRGIVDAIFDAVTAFQRGAPRHDDMTAVAVKIVGKGDVKPGS